MHTLTADEADQVNTANGFSRGPQDIPEDNPGAVEGDEYPCFDLPNGERWVFVGSGGFVQMEAADTDETSYEGDSELDDLENEDRYRAVWSDWDTLSDDEKRARVYPQSATQGGTPDVAPVTPVAPPSA